MGRIAKVSVSVPEELKKKMEHFSGVNWSEIAGEAFEEAIKKREMLQAAKTMDRLRESTKLAGWSGDREIRKWRDANRQDRLFQLRPVKFTKKIRASEIDTVLYGPS